VAARRAVCHWKIQRRRAFRASRPDAKGLLRAERSVAPKESVSPNKPLGAPMREAAIVQGVGTAVALVKAMVGALPVELYFIAKITWPA
jgi:hypothetical protein